MTCPTCGFESPPGFAFCGKCGAALPAGGWSADEPLTPADLDHLRRYLAPNLIEALRFDRVVPPPRLLEQCLAGLDQLCTATARHLPDYLVATVLHDPQPGRIGGQ